jgi:hypothetical protein
MNLATFNKCLLFCLIAMILAIFPRLTLSEDFDDEENDKIQLRVYEDDCLGLNEKVWLIIHVTSDKLTVPTLYCGPVPTCNTFTCWLVFNRYIKPVNMKCSKSPLTYL